MDPWSDPNRPVDERVEALVAELTLEELIGQLGSFWPRPKSDGAGLNDVAPMESAMSSGAFDEVARHGLGHLTRVFGSAPIEVAAGVQALARSQAAVQERSRFRIPAIAHEECLTGFTAYGATVYPAAIAWGATFDPTLVEEMAHAIGSDMAALGVHQGLSPLLDVVRDYRWGRVEETIGEDPLLVGTLGSAYVRGLQGAGVLATLKHFVGYSASRAGRNHAPVSIGPRELEDILLPPFEMAVREGGAASVMNSYSDLDGVPAGASRQLLTGTLRDRWGFAGTVVSDYWSVTFLQTMHRVAEDLASAGALSLDAGMDVELPETGAFAHLAEALERGLVSEDAIRTAARRVLTQKVQLGLLDPDWSPDAGRPVDLDSARNRDIARRLAEQSIVLCANEAGALPLRADRIALVGPITGDPLTFFGCYAFPNHVLTRYPELDNGLPIQTLADAVRAEFADADVAVAQGVGILDPDTSGIADAVAAARDADVAVVAVGDLAGMFGKGTSGEGCDAVDLRLPGAQADLVRAVLDTGTPTVLLVVSGRPYSLGEFAGRAVAVVQSFMPGVEGGGAIAGVLSGRVNPSGKLPVGVPDHPGGQPGTYLNPPLGWFSEGVSNLDPRPLYPFGHGRSYTTFTVTGLTLDTAEVPTDGVLEASVTVTNTGDRDGAEVVQFYLSDLGGQVVRPLKTLTAFARVPLAAGASATVTVGLDADLMSFTGLDLTRVVEPGAMQLHAGSSSEDLPLTADFTLTGPMRRVGEGRTLSPTITVA